MKIFAFLCVQAITAQDECVKPENEGLSNNYCRTRGKTVDNEKLYSDAVNRYRDQEAEFNFLGQCYNAVKKWGQGQGDREWNFKECAGCGGSDRENRDCCLESDWNSIGEALQFINAFGESTLNEANKLYTKMLNYKT